MKELQDAISELGKRGVETFVAEVVSVDKIKGTCTVKDEDLEYADVRLSAVIDERNDVFYFFPKVGSSVLVSPIHEDIQQLYVESWSEVEQVQLKIGQTEWKADDEGILLKKENETLREVLLDLIGAIKNMVFTTNVGPTIELVNLLEFEELEPRIENLLKAD